MTAHRVAELEGALLDAAVAKAEGVRAVVERALITISNEDGSLDRVLVDEDRCHRLYRSHDGTEKGGFWLNYSGKWELGGPIIQRERIGLAPQEGGGWNGYLFDDVARLMVLDCDGPTPLIAAMRAYVASKFGDTVELT